MQKALFFLIAEFLIQITEIVVKKFISISVD